MRILVTFAVTVGLTVALAWVPMPGLQWRAARWAAYLPVLAVSGRYGPWAGLWAGVATSFLWAFLTVSMGVNNVALLTFLVPDFALIGLFGGRLLGLRQPSRRRNLASGKQASGFRKNPEPAIEFNLDPLASIQSAAGLLAEDDTSANVRQELADIISTECGRLEAGINSMAQRCAPATPPQVDEVDLKPIIDAAVEEAEFVFCERGIVVEKQIAAELPRIEGDPDQIRNLLITLTTNAVQSATHDLVIDVRRGEDGVILEVRDQRKGSGIRRILERFFGTATASSGAGLATAYDIVRQHGGIIKATVKAQKGIEFLVWLPLRQNKVNGDWPRASGGGR